MGVETYVFYRHNRQKELGQKPMSAQVFNSIADNVRIVCEVSRCEELYHMLITALLEFNALPLKESEYCRYANREELHTSFYRIECNRRAANFLTVLKMYREFVCPTANDERSKYGVSKRLFEKKEFRFCDALRNYIQHIDCFPITLTNNCCCLACDEKLRTSHVIIPIKELSRKFDRAKGGTKDDLLLLEKSLTEVDLTQAFQMVMDFVDEIQTSVRNGSFSRSNFESARDSLEEIEAEYLDQGYFDYRFEEDEELDCRGSMPYLAQRQLELIKHFREIYPCKGGNANTYATSMPSSIMNRLSVADKNVAEYVRNGGVIASFEREKRTITSTKYTTKEMREWYLKAEGVLSCL